MSSSLKSLLFGVTAFRWMISSRKRTLKALTVSIAVDEISGLGVLKKVYFYLLFVINYTYALLKAYINRLFMRTWCTMKDPKRLKDAGDLYLLL
jgi:hypothetical protein